MAGFILGQVQSKGRKAGKPDLISSSFRSLVGPPTVAISRGFDWWADFSHGVTQAAALRKKVRMLQDQVNATAGYTEQVEVLNAEIDSLRKLQGFAALPGHARIPAQINGVFAFDNRVTLDVGTKDGVQPNMPVITGRGLLGIVQTAQADQCQVLLITSPTIQIGAIALREPAPAGLLKGENANTLIVQFLDPNTQAQTGDEVVTSGFSDKIPRGIPIGRIIKIDDNPDFGTRRAIVYPWASLGEAHEVYVLK